MNILIYTIYIHIYIYMYVCANGLINSPVFPGKISILVGSPMFYIELDIYICIYQEYNPLCCICPLYITS